MDRHLGRLEFLGKAALKHLSSANQEIPMPNATSQELKAALKALIRVR
jgi:hypothetical protein